MRFLPVIAILLAALWLAAAPPSARAGWRDEDSGASAAPPLDEYNDVPPGLLLDKDTDTATPDGDTLFNDNPAQSEDDSDAEAMTLDDISNAFKEGKYALIAKRVQVLAKNGHHPSEEMLGIMYTSGLGVQKNSEQAIIWLTKAAEAGRPLAQHHLGIITLAGEGLPADPVRALMWMNIAIAYYPDGDEKKRAMEDRDNIAAGLSRRDRDRALEMAGDWLKKRGEGHLLPEAQE